ncbi:nitroreductase family protein [Lactococcus termiticola]|uniref:Nitroreductase domain-containing protein n=1 Tax=Lactococcus termiticola TaxID=2169526 RepID=A0A2R5HEG0_9LACT|nr:nitroreductase family protein [Lactococcus termiticola]GBG96412.1 hypothetical protein NtB2_00524 [Lactococcus termiticola]
MTYLDTLKKRRTIYALGKNLNNADEVIETIKEAVRLSPSAFNAQTARAVILTGAKHDEFWDDIVTSSLKAVMTQDGVLDESAWEATQGRLNGFKAGYGTVLLFEDMATVANLEEQFPLYADNFKPWAEQSHGIVLANIWNALAEAGVGGNIQHYNPLVDEKVVAAYDVPKDWKLRGQFVFGSIEAPNTVDKETLGDDVRFKEFK